MLCTTIISAQKTNYVFDGLERNMVFFNSYNSYNKKIYEAVNYAGNVKQTNISRGEDHRPQARICLNKS